MTAALLVAFAAAFLAGFGGRDQLIVARLRQALGPSLGLLVTATACAVLSAAIMAWAGASLAEMVTETAKSLLVALALLLAAVELLWPNRVRRPSEPTRSLGAVALVLLARQLVDAPRLLTFAIGAATAMPLQTAIGGALGGAAVIAVGWAVGEALENSWPLRITRIALGALLLIVAALIGLTARMVFG